MVATITGRDKRQAHMMRLFLKGLAIVLAVFLLIVPGCILTIYYHFGWKPAVLAFPIVQSLSFWILNPYPARKSRKLVARIGSLLTRSGLIIVPVAAVLASDPNIMRLWAVFIALGLFFDAGVDRRLAELFAKPGQLKLAMSAAICGTTALVFIGLSELVWFKAGLSAWIWYHSFFVPVLLLSFLGPFIAARFFFSGGISERDAGFVQKGRLPKVEEPSVEARYDVCWVNGDGSRTVYANASLAQAMRIFARRTMASGEPDDASKLAVTFEADLILPYAFLIFPHDAYRASASWSYPGKRKPLKLFRPRIDRNAENIPTALVPVALEFAWNGRLGGT